MSDVKYDKFAEILSQLKNTLPPNITINDFKGGPVYTPELKAIEDVKLRYHQEMVEEITRNIIVALLSDNGYIKDSVEDYVIQPELVFLNSHANPLWAIKLVSKNIITGYINPHRLEDLLTSIYFYETPDKIQPITLNNITQAIVSIMLTDLLVHVKEIDLYRTALFQKEVRENFTKRTIDVNAGILEQTYNLLSNIEAHGPNTDFSTEVFMADLKMAHQLISRHAPEESKTDD